MKRKINRKTEKTPPSPKESGFRTSTVFYAFFEQKMPCDKFVRLLLHLCIIKNKHDFEVKLDY